MPHSQQETKNELENLRVIWAGRDIWGSLAQLPTQSKANSKVRSALNLDEVVQGHLLGLWVQQRNNPASWFNPSWKQLHTSMGRETMGRVTGRKPMAWDKDIGR